jgi:hypothetical protein
LHESHEDAVFPAEEGTYPRCGYLTSYRERI